MVPWAVCRGYTPFPNSSRHFGNGWQIKVVICGLQGRRILSPGACHGSQYCSASKIFSRLYYYRLHSLNSWTPLFHLTLTPEVNSILILSLNDLRAGRKPYSPHPTAVSAVNFSCSLVALHIRIKRFLKLFETPGLTFQPSGLLCPFQM